MSVWRDSDRADGACGGCGRPRREHVVEWSERCPSDAAAKVIERAVRQLRQMASEMPVAGEFIREMRGQIGWVHTLTEAWPYNLRLYADVLEQAADGAGARYWEDAHDEVSGLARWYAATLAMIATQAEATLREGGDSIPAEWLVSRCDEALKSLPPTTGSEDA